MARDLRLVRSEHLNKEANADLLVSYQVEQTETGAIRKRFEEQFNAVILIGHVSIVLT